MVIAAMIIPYAGIHVRRSCERVATGVVIPFAGTHARRSCEREAMGDDLSKVNHGTIRFPGEKGSRPERDPVMPPDRETNCGQD